MMASCLGRVPLTAFVSHIGRQPLKPILQPSRLQTRVQQYAQGLKGGRAERRAANKTRTGLKGTLMDPAGLTGVSAVRIGKSAVMGASFLGLGALCFYGLGLSGEASALDNSLMWTDEVKKRIRGTYMYFAATVTTTAISTLGLSQNQKLMRLMTSNSLLAIGATFAVVIGAGMAVRSMPYKEGFCTKQLALLAYGGVIGAIVAPLTLLGGPLLARAAWYTAGIVGGLSALAMSAPSEKFLTMGGPLAIGFGFVFVSSFAGMFFPATTALGAGLYSISIYGGLVLFGAFLLYDTQKIVKKAETHPIYGEGPYDPINACLSIYMDTLNIFMRIAIILSGSNRKK